MIDCDERKIAHNLAPARETDFSWQKPRSLLFLAFKLLRFSLGLRRKMCPGELLFYWSEHTQRMLNKLRSQLIWITACSIDFTRYRSISSNISNCITNQAETPPRRSRRSHIDNEHIHIIYIMLYWRQLTVCSARTAILSSQPKSKVIHLYTAPRIFFLMTEILISEAASSFAAFRTPQGKNLFIFTGHFNRFSAPSATQI